MLCLFCELESFVSLLIDPVLPIFMPGALKTAVEMLLVCEPSNLAWKLWVETPAG